MDKRRLVHVAVLAAVPFVMVLGNSMLIPVFPQLKRAMDLTQFQVGLLITVFSIPAALVIPFAGVLSDHIGRRKVIAPALAVYGLGGLIAGGAALLLEQPYGVVLAGRIVQGVGAGGTYLLAVALAGDLFTGSGRTKVLGVLEAANGVGKVVSPILGAAVALIVWWAPFFVYGVLALPVALLVWFVIDEPPVEQGRGLRGDVLGAGPHLSRPGRFPGGDVSGRHGRVVSAVRRLVVFVRRAGAAIRHRGVCGRPRAGRARGGHGRHRLPGGALFEKRLSCGLKPAILAAVGRRGGVAGRRGAVF